MRLLMIDDHVMFLEGLQGLLGTLAPQLQTDAVATLAAALERVRQVNYNLVLLDWNLDHAHTGAAAIERLREAGCVARIVVLSGDTDPQLMHQAIELGAAGFVPKRFGTQAMLQALEQVLAGNIFLPHEALSHAAHLGEAGDPAVADARERLATLTPRQFEVYQAAARGLPNKLIAAELGVAESTVKTHLKAVFAALGVRNRTEAAYQASRDGIRIE